MYLYIFDSDNAFFHALKNAIGIVNNQKIQLYHYTTIEDFLDTIGSANSPAMFLLDLESIESQTFNAWYKLKNIPFLILCEGVINLKQEDLIKSSFDIEDLDELLILKYQNIDLLWKNITKRFISKGTYRSISSENCTELISFYTPYGIDNFSSSIEKWLEKYADVRSISLLIHYDPFYRNESSDYNLSVVFSKISRKGNNSAWIIQEIVRRISKSLDIIDSPLHMYDIDYLSEEKLEIFIEWLKSKTQYQRVIFNFNGVHISKHINRILESSSKCVLFSKNEIVQQNIMKQYAYKWNILNGENELLVKELMMNRN